MAANKAIPTWEVVPFTFDELVARRQVLTNGEDLRPGDVVMSYYGVIYLVQKIFPDTSTFQVLTTDNETTQDTCLTGPNYFRVWSGSDETPKSGYNVEDGFCPKCEVKLEWTHMAEKCPSCWKVYTGA